MAVTAVSRTFYTLVALVGQSPQWIGKSSVGEQSRFATKGQAMKRFHQVKKNLGARGYDSAILRKHTVGILKGEVVGEMKIKTVATATATGSSKKSKKRRKDKEVA